MKYLTFADYCSLAVSLFFLLAFGIAIDVVLDIAQTLGETGDILVGAVIAIMLTVCIGPDIVANVRNNVRSRRIKDEIAMERSFRKMGGE